ncbi:MAG: RNA 3'-phosphate cyclase [Chloroflexi bacterium]|nr:RNA 3'-phosphate cyclase [Chloroflexota bacterium]
MIHIDGSAKSGSGTIVRYAVALSSLLGEELHVDNIRAKRDKPGLRPQHLTSVKACARMCGAQVEGAAVDSREIFYRPGKRIKGGEYQWEIGTAGSTTLLVMTLLPIALFADEETVLTISGGLFQDFAPSVHHMQHVLFPTLEKMGIKASLEIARPGYVPRGGGVIRVSIEPVRNSVRPLKLLKQGNVKQVVGIALSSHLKERKVSQRMAETCQKVLATKGYRARIETAWDETALQAGASLAVWAETDSGCLLGADQAGARGRSSESIGQFVAQNLIEDLEAGATVDRYLSDQLIIYATLASGTTEYIVPRITEHVDSNLWLVEKFGAKTRVEGNRLFIDGIAYTGLHSISPPMTV